MIGALVATYFTICWTTVIGLSLFLAYQMVKELLAKKEC